MIYTELTKKALQIAFDAHKEQVDKSGLPYIFHPFHLAEQMETEDEVCAALLHDVMEDSDITLDELRSHGFSESVMDALALLTHDDGTEYMDYIAKIKSSPLAVKVKLADLRHNSDVTRIELDMIDAKMIARFDKYRKAINNLVDAQLERQIRYLRKMNNLEILKAALFTCEDQISRVEDGIMLDSGDVLPDVINTAKLNRLEEEAKEYEAKIAKLEEEMKGDR